MKKILLCLLFPLSAAAQKTMHLVLGGATTKGAMVGITMQDKHFRIGLGGTMQFGGQYLLGKNVKYGGKNNPNGVGVYYSTFDFSIGYVDKGFSLQIEVSPGLQKSYENYTNESVFIKQYHYNSGKRQFVGVGANLGINIDKNFEVFAGYNTVKKGIFGIRLGFGK